MNLRCVFHVSPVTIHTRAEPLRAERAEVRPRMPSLLDLDITWDEEAKPRGASIETWNRARGWATED
jgi:hypothetical protein